MNILFYTLFFVGSFIVGAVSMAFAYAWHVITHDKILVVDRNKNMCHFMDRLTFIHQEVLKINNEITEMNMR